MNTKKVILFSSDRELTGIIKISALTLTKLNCQVSITETVIPESVIKELKVSYPDLIIIDLDEKKSDAADLIKKIRTEKSAGARKILSLYTLTADKEEIYKAGCDSIMSKDEFKKVVNNILQF
ncbi:MAG: response regulator [Ignavibacteria bacterium]|nr:response regulator [Ignavibacteria bacterium]